MTNNANPEALTYSVKEAAQLLGSCPNTVYRAAKANQIPKINLRGRVLIPKAKLQKWLEEGGKVAD